MENRNKALHELCTLCRILAETEESHTEDFPGLKVQGYLDTWTVCDNGEIAFPKELVEQPFAHQAVYNGSLCIFMVDTITLLDWLVSFGTIRPAMKELALVKLTLDLMDG